MTLIEAIKEAIKHAEGVMDENMEMTKEEAKDYIREWCPYDRQEEIIKALEQESVLNKIRAEIVDLGQRTMNDNRANGIWACRDIIDKYKAESEDKE